MADGVHCYNTAGTRAWNAPLSNMGAKKKDSNGEEESSGDELVGESADAEPGDEVPDFDGRYMFPALTRWTWFCQQFRAKFRRGIHRECLSQAFEEHGQKPETQIQGPSNTRFIVHAVHFLDQQLGVVQVLLRSCFFLFGRRFERSPQCPPTLQTLSKFQNCRTLSNPLQHLGSWECSHVHSSQALEVLPFAFPAPGSAILCTSSPKQSRTLWPGLWKCKPPHFHPLWQYVRTLGSKPVYRPFKTCLREAKGRP